MSSPRRALFAHVLPMAVFMVLLALREWLSGMSGAFALRHSEFWVYPVQTVLCAAIVVWFWRCYDFRALRNVPFTLLAAAAVFVLWICPQQFFGFAPRTGGFDPALVISDPAIYWLTIALRFLRLVIVVPFVEEIFWRGFLLRYLIDEDFQRVPFGAFSWLSFAVVTAAFALSHSRADWAAAAVTGAVYNGVAYRTRSLPSCILAHAGTNLLLGLWIMHTQQWGFW
jgi:CAAX prenyl protease-like protein